MIRGVEAAEMIVVPFREEAIPEEAAAERAQETLAEGIDLIEKEDLEDINYSRFNMLLHMLHNW